MNNYIVSEILVNTLLNYLGSKPYIEVASLINRLQTLPKYSEPKGVGEDGNRQDDGEVQG